MVYKMKPSSLWKQKNFMPQCEDGEMAYRSSIFGGFNLLFK